MYNTESTFLLQGHQIYCLQACICALLNPELLQAGTVKGVKVPPLLTQQSYRGILTFNLGLID